jgi:hypothetical protein
MLHERNVTEFKTLKIAFGLSFFNLCVGRLLVQNVIFLTFFQKTENRPLLAHQKGHNF